MAFQLARNVDGTWGGKNGATVTVDVRSPQPAKTVRIAYGGKEDGIAPFQFDIRNGLSSLLIVALGVKNGQQVDIVEVDGVNEQILKSFIWSKSNFFDFVQVRGKAA